MAKREELIVGLDIGTTKVACLVGELTDEGIDIKVLAGSEVDILSDGTLDYDDDLLAELDVELAALPAQGARADGELRRAAADLRGAPLGERPGGRAWAVEGDVHGAVLERVGLHPAGRGLGARPGVPGREHVAQHADEGEPVLAVRADIGDIEDRARVGRRHRQAVGLAAAEGGAGEPGIVEGDRGGAGADEHQRSAFEQGQLLRPEPGVVAVGRARGAGREADLVEPGRRGDAQRYRRLEHGDRVAAPAGRAAGAHGHTGELRGRRGAREAPGQRRGPGRGRRRAAGDHRPVEVGRLDRPDHGADLDAADQAVAQPDRAATVAGLGVDVGRGHGAQRPLGCRGRAGGAVGRAQGGRLGGGQGQGEAGGENGRQDR